MTDGDARNKIAETIADAYKQVGKGDKEAWMRGFSHGLLFAEQIVENQGVNGLKMYVSPMMNKGSGE